MAQENDVVLIYFEDEPMVFARIENIQPDVKPDWWLVTLLMLQLPLQTVTWILRDAYINGDEFTMNEKRVRLEKVVNPEMPFAEQTDTDTDNENPKSSEQAKVISFKDLKKK